MSLPWTHSEYEQLIGRIFRQGSNYNKIDVIIPKVIIKYTEDSKQKTWSRDRHKLNVIKFKRNLFDIVVNGIIPSNIVSDLTNIKRKTIDTLNEIINKVNDGLIEIDRDETMKEFLNHSDLDNYRRKLGEFSEIQKLWSTRRSDNNFKEIQKNRESWDNYHKAYREIRKNWGENVPYHVIAEKIKKLNKPNLVVADFGCGDNLLKNEIQNKVLSFDMGSNINDNVIICDMSKLPIEDNSVHIGVFSLSLMGSNYTEYLKEAKRVIVNGGRLYIAEPYERWQNREDGVDEIKSELEIEGFEVIGNIVTTERFIYVEAINSL
jgi:hypothetical protein